jgi:hypothetical protein
MFLRDRATSPLLYVIESKGDTRKEEARRQRSNQLNYVPTRQNETRNS